MTLLAAIVWPIVVAVLTGVGGYRYRRREHLRERRLDAYSEVLGAFQAAAVVGADMLSVHGQLGYPYEFGPAPTEEEEEMLLERQRRTAAYGTALMDANEKRRAFEVGLGEGVARRRSVTCGTSCEPFGRSSTRRCGMASRG